MTIAGGGRMKQSHKNFINTVLALLMSVASLHASTSAHSASNGDLATSSIASADVSLAIPQLYLISGVADFSFGTYSGSGNLSANYDLCVYSNDSSAGYKVRVTDSSALSADGYSVQNAAGTAQIPFNVKWKSGVGSTGNRQLTYNVAHTQTAANTTTPNCNGTNNANIQINLLQSDLQGAPSDTYSSTLTISIEP